MRSGPLCPRCRWRAVCGTLCVPSLKGRCGSSYPLDSRSSLANGKPTLLLMSHARCWYWHSCHGGSERNSGHQVRKPGICCVCIVSGGAFHFGCFPFRCRGWCEAIPEDSAAVLFLLGRRVRSLL